MGCLGEHPQTGAQRSASPKPPRFAPCPELVGASPEQIMPGSHKVIYLLTDLRSQEQGPLFPRLKKGQAPARLSSTKTCRFSPRMQEGFGGSSLATLARLFGWDHLQMLARRKQH